MPQRKSITLLILSVMALVVMVISYLVFRIARIECNLGNQTCPQEVMSAFRLVEGQSLFFFNDGQLPAALQSFPAYQITEYYFTLPNVLHIHVAPQTITYKLSSEIQTETLVVTSEGFLLTNQEQATVPLVLLNQDTWSQVQQTQQLDPHLHLIFTNALNDLKNIDITNPVFYLRDSQTLVMYLPDQPVVIIDPQQTQASAARLKAVLTELANNPDSALIKEVDVRYNLPVLRQSASIPRHTSY